jgi:hypothetical protein
MKKRKRLYTVNTRKDQGYSFQEKVRQVRVKWNNLAMPPSKNGNHHHQKKKKVGTHLAI